MGVLVIFNQFKSFRKYLALLLIASSVDGFSFQLGMLGKDPDWSTLDSYQRTMTRQAFVEALETVYLPYGIDENWISLFPEYALIRTDSDHPDAFYRVEFASSEDLWEERQPPKKSRPTPGEFPLKGLVIAIDPGHIGGDYSVMEQRHIQVGQGRPVKEGDLTLLVSLKLRKRLEDLGATVHLTREDLQPVTPCRPSDFLDEAQGIERQLWLESQSIPPSMLPWETDWFKKRVKERAEMLFFRVSEIQSRADLINGSIQPDFTLAVHFNVTPWPEATLQELPVENHLHLLVNGTYMPSELALDDIRLQLFRKLLSRNHELEIPLSAAVAQSMVKTTGLPPYFYGGRNASNQGNNPYLWARNLLANRLYQGPVVFLEAYCVNSRDVYERVQLGDYEGLREVGGQMKASLFEEYASGVVDGLVDYYSPFR